MAAISLPLKGNVLYPEPQTLEFEKIATFIGGNGSGKSTILKSIFDEKLKGSTYQDYKIVCFSSGQNESYSSGFSAYLNAERSKKNALSLDCFYYDKMWSKLLIFLSTTSKPDGLVRTFLKQHSYVVENELDGDGTTRLLINVKIDRGYVNLVKQAREDEKNGETDLIINSAYHLTLANFINKLIDSDYEFNAQLEQRSIELSQDVLSGVSFETDVHSTFDSMVMFFTQAADNDYFIVKESFKLIFKNGDNDLRLEDLSDGEYQLLFIYSLFDLFDAESTLFLLDEADSHLHYKNVEKLWSVFDFAKGGVITTTHLIDSIAKSGIERLKVVERGRVNSEELKGVSIALNLSDADPFNYAFEISGDSTRATLFAPRPLTKMDSADRIRAVYLHACLRYVQREFMTNTSLRERFGIDPKNSATASRLLKEALVAEDIHLQDKSAPPKLRRYVPKWA